MIPFERLWFQSERKLAGLAKRLCLIPTDSEDLLQETRLRCFVAFERYDPARSFENWAMAVMRNLDRSRRRQLQAGPIQLSLDSSFASEEEGGATWEIADPRDPFATIFDDSAMVCAFRVLPPVERETVQRFLACLGDSRLTADLLGISMPTLRSRLFRARESMKRGLEIFLN